MKSFVALRTFFLLLVIAFLASASLPAQQPAPGGETLFQNVRIFDGKSPKLSAPSLVLVHGNKIEKISTTPIPADKRADTVLIDGQGKTLMPGLIDAHTHIMFEKLPSQILALTADIGYVNVVAVKAAQDMLLGGWTSIRDVGGPAFGLKRAIDEGLEPGPRIYASGAMISQSGGHGDFRLPTELPARPGDFSYGDRVGATAIADGPDAVRQRTREQLALGASQIKLMAGGGVASPYDPIDVTQFTIPEMQAAVEAAENWGTYVLVHAYTPRAIQMALKAGVKCIEHGQLVNEETAKLMADRKVWWCLQPFLDDEDANPQKGAARVKQMEMMRGTETAYNLAKKYKIKAAFGTDILFAPNLSARRGAMLAKLTRWYTPAEVLKMATADNAELLAMSGERNPYPGKLGVVEEGALADLLLVDGDPIANIKLIEDPAKNFTVIMKDGVIYKGAGR